MKIVLETIVESISSRVDGSISIKIGTQEMDSSKVGVSTLKRLFLTAIYLHWRRS